MDVRIVYRIALDDAAALAATYRSADVPTLVRSTASRVLVHAFASRTLDEVLGEQRAGLAEQIGQAVRSRPPRQRRRGTGRGGRGDPSAGRCGERLPRGAGRADHRTGADRPRARAGCRAAQRGATTGQRGARPGQRAGPRDPAAAQARRPALRRRAGKAMPTPARLSCWRPTASSGLGLQAAAHHEESALGGLGHSPLSHSRGHHHAITITITITITVTAMAHRPRRPGAGCWSPRCWCCAVAAACLVQVRSGEAMVITRFGNPARVLLEPGLAWRLPLPFESAIPVDLRLRTTSSGLQDVGTRDGLRIIVQAYVAWQVRATPTTCSASCARCATSRTRLPGSCAPSSARRWKPPPAPDLRPWW